MKSALVIPVTVKLVSGLELLTSIIRAGFGFEFVDQTFVCKLPQAKSAGSYTNILREEDWPGKTYKILSEERLVSAETWPAQFVEEELVSGRA